MKLLPEHILSLILRRILFSSSYELFFTMRNYVQGYESWAYGQLIDVISLALCLQIAFSFIKNDIIKWKKLILSGWNYQALSTHFVLF